MGILKKWLNKLLAVSATRRSPRPAKPSEDHRATPRHLGEKPIHVEEDLRESSALRVKSCDEGAWTVDIRGPNDPTTPEGKPEATTHPGDGSLPAKAEETEDGTHDRLENVTGSPRLTNPTPEAADESSDTGTRTRSSTPTTIQPRTTSGSSSAFRKLENGDAAKAYEQNVETNHVTELNHLRAENENLRTALRVSDYNAGELRAQNRLDLLKHEALFSAKEQEQEDHRTKASADMTSRDTRIRELERLNSSLQARDADQSRAIAQLEHQNRILDDSLRTQRGIVDDLMKEREQAMANRLKIDTFDSSIDRASEAQLISHIEDINSLVDDLVASVLEDVTSFIETHPSDPSSDATMMDPQSSRLLKHALEMDPGSDNWGLLVDCLLHQKIVEYLHTAVFSSSFGVPVPDGSDGENLEVLHKCITGQEKWRATQRWRSVTAKGLDGITSESTWRSMTTTLAHDIQNTLAAATYQSYAALDPFHDSIDGGLKKVFKQARKASLMISTDMVSVRVRVVLGTMQPECKEILWPEMDGKPDDTDVGDYSLGLLKVDEHDKATALLASKVATHAVIRYVHTNVA